jgi:hypothetical protein
MLQFLHLPLFIPTFVAVLFRPLRFFRAYHELVKTRPGSFWDLNAEKEGDRYLGPVKFSALAIAISNLLLPVILMLGVEVGAVSRDYAQFAEWAEQQGYLDPPEFTGVGLIDDVIREVLVLAMFYGLGCLIALFSGRRIPARFAAGYFFYWNAWGLLGSLVSVAFILVAWIIPIFDTGLPFLVGQVINIASMFMFVGFPIFFWPRIVDVSWQRTAVALVGGMAVWIGAIAILAPLIVDIPQF